ncbi:hypothetical protein [Clostridium psychrophilum]|nr:hypothetical protein [Clostridium psychrophilum]MBU3182772.1 hypothetical protein [Clostridium psychrophilum]
MSESNLLIIITFFIYNVKNLLPTKARDFIHILDYNKHLRTLFIFAA